MFSLKNNTYPLFLLALLSACTIVFSSSCTTEGCTNEFADNYDVNADDDDGTCILSREKFLGNFEVMETCETNFNSEYAIDVLESTNAENEIVVTDNAGFTFNATVDQSSLTILPTQLELIGVTIDLTGTGSISGDNMTINYSWTSALGGENCTMNCTRLE